MHWPAPRVPRVERLSQAPTQPAHGLAHTNLPQRPIGRPLGTIQPSFHDTRMNTNSATDKAMRTVNARAILLSRPSPCLDLRSMKKPALAKAANTPSSAIRMMVFMAPDCRIRAFADPLP